MKKRATRVGVAVSKARDAFTAGSAAAKEAVEKLEGSPASFFLVFGTTGYDQQELLRGIGEIAGSVPYSGCSGEGVITQGKADEESHAVVVMAFASETMRFTPLHFEKASDDPIAAADSLAKAIQEKARPGENHVLWIFPDGLQVRSRDVLERLDEKLPFPMTVVGGASGAIFDTWKTYQYHQGKAFQGSVAAVLVGGSFTMEVAVSHGCEPIGIERTVTEASDGYVRSIDGKPAFEAFKEYLDKDPRDLVASDLNHLCLGRELPAEHKGSYGDLIVAAPAGLDKETGAIFFPAGIRSGTKVYMTRRDPARVRESTVAATQSLRSKRPGEVPVFVLQFDCCSRGQVLFGQKTTEATVSPIQKVLGESLPWIGFHCYGEIAPLGGKTYYHNYTVALCAVYEQSGES